MIGIIGVMNIKLEAIIKDSKELISVIWLKKSF